MSLIIDRKFISLVSTKLDRFAQKNDYLWNFRCPVCGDSKKNKLKARAYFYRKKSNLSFMCHNCHASMSFGNFLKTIDKSLYKEYQLERYKEESHSNVKQPDFTIAKTKPVFNAIKIPTIDSLPYDHVAKKYVLDRHIPLTYWKNLYYADDFKQFVAETFPNSKAQLFDNDKRLVIPFYDEKNILLGAQGRTLSASKVRYITVKSSEDSKKIFGLDRINFSKTIYVVEGPIDSMFLENSIASMDASLYNIVSLIGNNDYVFVYDNEPRNKDIIKCMQKTIEKRMKICIWPSNVKEKDVNEMVLGGLNPLHIIRSNTFEGPRAKLEFEQWKKV